MAIIVQVFYSYVLLKSLSESHNKENTKYIFAVII